MILVTGDIHGFRDAEGASRFSRKNKLWQARLRHMTKADYVIICGDFGLTWDNSREELYWRRWLDRKPFTTLFLDGNHENFDLLETFPQEEWNGGRVHRISDSILHLMRGQVFTLQGRRIFTLGGAESHDKHYRTEGLNWWPQEMPTAAELAEARNALERAGWSVDTVLTHSFPTAVQDAIYEEKGVYPANPLTEFLTEVYSHLDFQEWYSGHYHLDGYLREDTRMHIIYRNLKEI